MSRTLKALAVEVAGLMNLKRPGEDLSQEFEADIIDKAKQVHSRLVDKEAAYWPADAIPEAVFSVVAMVVAFEVSPKFGALPVLATMFGIPNIPAAFNAGLVQLRIHCEKEFNNEYEGIKEY